MNQDTQQGDLDKRSRHSLSIGFIKYGLVGFMIVVPAIIGAIVGSSLDPPESNTWALILLATGFLVGTIAAVLWIRREIRYDKRI